MHLLRSKFYYQRVHQSFIDRVQEGTKTRNHDEKTATGDDWWTDDRRVQDHCTKDAAIRFCNSIPPKSVACHLRDSASPRQGFLWAFNEGHLLKPCFLHSSITSTTRGVLSDEIVTRFKKPRTFSNIRAWGPTRPKQGCTQNSPSLPSPLWMHEPRVTKTRNTSSDFLLLFALFVQFFFFSFSLFPQTSNALLTWITTNVINDPIRLNNRFRGFQPQIEILNLRFQNLGRRQGATSEKLKKR